MEITYLGNSCFRIKTSKTAVLTDPFDPKTTGLPFPKTNADIVTISHFHSDHNFREKIVPYKRESVFFIDAPGEYEIGGVEIRGFSSFHDDKKGEERGKNTIYLIESENVRICHLGDLGEDLSDKKIELLGEVDVLMIPVAGKVTISPQKASQIVKRLAPKIAIPMHYFLKGMKEELAQKFAKVEEFLDAMDVEGLKPEEKLQIDKEHLPEETTVVVLEMKNGKL